MKIGFFGLGSMGYGMAASLLRAGHTVWGFDVYQPQVDKLVNEGGHSGDLASVAPELDAVVVTVLNAAQTQSVLFGDNAVAPLLKNQVAQKHLPQPSLR